jgi:hypothetical protein
MGWTKNVYIRSATRYVCLPNVGGVRPNRIIFEGISFIYLATHRGYPWEERGEGMDGVVRGSR